MTDLGRRLVLRQMCVAFASGVAAPALVSAADAPASCVNPDSESLRTSLHYASVSPVAGQSCSLCSFFTRDEAKPACGQCAIMSGPVDEKGRCDSFSARS
jgi:hypothetical protein